MNEKQGHNSSPEKTPDFEISLIPAQRIWDPGHPKSEASAYSGLSEINSMMVQTISLKSGWNIISLFLIPHNPDLKSVFQSLITDGSLIKVQDESGNSLEDFGIFGGWTNNIGNISLTEGYKVKTTRVCQLFIEGIPPAYPYKIPLKTGWNIMGYPRQTEADGMKVVQSLIDRKSLVKVQDETGKSIEDMGIFGGWTNHIGNFKPGKGYKIKVISGDSLTIDFNNQPPGIPSSPVPADSAFRAEVIPALSWSCSDPDGDLLSYDIFFGSTPVSQELIQGNISTSSYTLTDSLNYGTAYYWKIVARDLYGYFREGPLWKFTVRNETGSFTDARDGISYKTVKIGAQWWMAGNLAYLPAVYPPSSGSVNVPIYYVSGYNGTDVSAAKSTANYAAYGVLYNWTAAMDSAASSNTVPGDVQGVCPAGWHLPGDSEWALLSDYLMNNGYGYKGSGNDIAKSLAAQTHWAVSSVSGSPGNNPDANNSSDFTGLPGGNRRNTGSFNDSGNSGRWWSSAESSVNFGWLWNLDFNNVIFYHSDSKKDYGLSVRCVKNIVTVPTVLTAAPVSVSYISAILGGEVLKDGDASVTERGVCYGTTVSPTIDGNKTVMGAGTGKFSALISGLAPNTIYYARAYAINSQGIAYGPQVTFSTLNAPVATFRGTVIKVEISWCMDGCGNYYLQPDPGYQSTNLTGTPDLLSQFTGAHVEVTGYVIFCLECGALYITKITVL